MNRWDLQALARRHLRSARALHRANPTAAYFLAGLAVELALKACIARRTRRYDFPEKKMANDSHVHDPTKLVTVAGLNRALDSEMKTSREFSLNWLIVRNWKSKRRYDPGVTTKDN